MWVFVILCSLYFTSVSIADNTDSGCDAVCGRTYPLHTYPTAEHLECCKRGCRLSAMLYFLHDCDKVKQLCTAACNDAYSKPYEQYACDIGCSNQDAPFLKLVEKNDSSYDVVVSVQSIFERMSGVISSNWILYISDEDVKSPIIGTSEDSSVQEDDLPKVMSFGDTWLTYHQEKSTGWLPKNKMSGTCFYDFLHFLFYKIMLLFLILLFILTGLSLVRITLFDNSKKKRGYVALIESSDYLNNHHYLTTKEKIVK